MDLLTRTSKGIWASVGTVALLAGWALSAVIFAWAVKSTKLFEGYAPFSWVFAAFAGAAVAAGVWRLGIAGHRQLIRNRYDARLLGHGGPIDPMARTFESKRIYLNEFALPSRPLIEDKTFIDCEIVGPANIILISGNNLADHRLPLCDALVIADGADPSNGYAFRNCVFRGCSFVRITLMTTRVEFDMAKKIEWLRWISIRPDYQPELLLEPTQVAPSLPGNYAYPR